ncbi:MAG: NRDE family protein [Saprospiraceae bacterium]|nr:NRDE family protein [Saprospiraceae bacterium]
MCTVTFVPLGQDDYVLTSNRDETPRRSPEKINRQNNLLFPMDTLSGGTWISVSDDNRMVCLLNGAFLKQQQQPPYRISRGVMVLDFFSFKSAADFSEQFDFTNIKPFTMVIFEKAQLFEYRWDGKKKYFRVLDRSKCHIWASATLYDTRAQAKRKTWFEDWKKKHKYTPENILAFHTNGGDGDPQNDMVMNRNDVIRTVSITQVIKQKHAIEMRYFDLLRSKHDMAQMYLEGEKVVEST